MRCSIILAAGKQRRFKSEIPKALYPINGLTILEHNMRILRKFSDKIFVVASTDNFEYFTYLNDKKNTKLVIIESGFGCGDAVYKSLKQIQSKYTDVILVWGDSIQDKNIIEKSINSINSNFCIPVTEEVNPYVQFLEKELFIDSVRFSKYNDKIDSIGYHDLSLFLFKKEECIEKLDLMIQKYAQKEDNVLKYKTRSNELVFLEMFNENFGKNYATLIKCGFNLNNAFNTIEEFSIVSNNLYK